MLAIVIPSCVAAIASSRREIASAAARAPPRPSATQISICVLRTATSANSVATKYAFMSTSAAIATSPPTERPKAGPSILLPSTGQRLAAGEVVDELLCAAARAAGAPERPAQRLGLQLVPGGLEPGARRVVLHHLEIGVLIERVEADHESEAIGERELLVDGLAHLEVAGGVETDLGVVRDALLDQVPPIARGDDADVLSGGRETALERRLELAIARIARIEREIVAEDQEALWSALE